MRVLVVEDERKIPAYVRRGLEQAGYAVDVAFTGTEALVGKTIEVTGEIYVNEFESKPEIEVSSPDQLVVK